MRRKNFAIHQQTVAVLISVALPMATIPFYTFAQETYPNLPQPRFQDSTTTPGPASENPNVADGGTEGATGGNGAQSGSVDAGGTVGSAIGNIGNAVSDASANSVPGAVAHAALVVGPGPSGTAVENAQVEISVFSTVTTGLLSVLGFS